MVPYKGYLINRYINNESYEVIRRCVCYWWVADFVYGLTNVYQV